MENPVCDPTDGGCLKEAAESNGVESAGSASGMPFSVFFYISLLNYLLFDMFSGFASSSK